MNIFKQTKIPIWNQNSFILDYLSQFGVWCPPSWNLIINHFGQNFDLTNQLHALTQVKKLNRKIFYISTIFPLYEINKVPYHYENLAFQMNTHYWAQKSLREFTFSRELYLYSISFRFPVLTITVAKLNFILFQWNPTYGVL